MPARKALSHAGSRLQELLEGFDGEAAEAARGTQAPLLAWLSGLTRKGRPEEELDEEALRVRPCRLGGRYPTLTVGTSAAGCGTDPLTAAWHLGTGLKGAGWGGPGARWRLCSQGAHLDVWVIARRPRLSCRGGRCLPGRTRRAEDVLPWRRRGRRSGCCSGRST